MTGHARRLWVGLMSGTSLDGVDGVLVDFDPAPIRVLAVSSVAFPAGLRGELLELQTPGSDELARAADVAVALADGYARVVHDVLAVAGVSSGDVAAIGCHGQTVRHRPERGWTIQINQPARLAEATGIAVVADFRSRDIAAGGQGAPLVPAFHAAVFRSTTRHRAILNIGGIANITDLPVDAPVRGWDTGPGNVLLDHWIGALCGERYDAAGALAASGRVDDALLARCLAEPYFRRPPPKSTGRDLFNGAWLAARGTAGIAASDVQATLAALTANSVARSIEGDCGPIQELYVCGGGALNNELMRLLRAALPGVAVDLTDAIGLPAGQVEPAAFAWLARQTIDGRSGNLPEVTGARGSRVLGAIYHS